MDELRFFNRYADIRFAANRLPHWQQEGAVYFVTFRLADGYRNACVMNGKMSATDGCERIQNRGAARPKLEYHKRFSGAMDQWLDAGHGSCVLRRPECARLVDETLQHFEGQRLALIASIVMPNHVHVLFAQNAEWPLEKILRSWKSFTSRRINALLGGNGGLWQRDYFDRLVRDEKHFANCVRYICRNPQRARLRDREYILYESDLAHSIE
jgi:REP-associated tyrosine transposase